MIGQREREREREREGGGRSTSGVFRWAGGRCSENDPKPMNPSAATLTAFLFN